MSSNAIMAGMYKADMAESIARCQGNFKTLILTVDLCLGFCDIRRVTDEVEDSNCTSVIIAHKLPEHVSDGYWKRWIRTWEGEVVYTRYSYLAENLSVGMRSMGDKGRPWVTAVSASTIESRDIALVELNSEFGFLAHVSNLVRESRAILFNPGQKDLLERLPRINNGGEELRLFEVTCQESMWTAMEHCFLDKRYSVVLLDDPNQLSLYAAEDLIDEIYHHITISSDDSAKKASSALGFLKLRDWTILSSEVVGNCMRMNIRSSASLPKRSSHSGDGFN